MPDTSSGCQHCLSLGSLEAAYTNCFFFPSVCFGNGATAGVWEHQEHQGPGGCLAAVAWGVGGGAVSSQHPEAACLLPGVWRQLPASILSGWLLPGWNMAPGAPELPASQGISE